ncbi:bacteriohemerythrin [Haloimpatiens sp. FM7315]|uniref:bacteriohemerythrin n=1 Tax=Haloimpatiens sp. FM7315 TaxID=3298609 RepID=UPI00397797D7
MDIIKWKNNYNTGIEEIDNQHKNLFRIANDAFSLLQDKFCIDKYDKIVDIIKELQDYTVYHFNSEEEYMKKIKYKKLISHKVEHDCFVKKIKEIDLNKIDSNQDKYILEILNFVVEWISHHIITQDKLIG